MMRLPFKKQICMEGGCMLDNVMLPLIIGFIGLFGVMLGFYLVLCFIQWVSDVVDEKRWLVWREWIK